MSQHSSNYDPSVHDELDSVDWKSVLPAVLKYAKYRLKILNWLGIDSDAEDLVQEAITMAYGRGANGAYRNWNKEKCPDIGVFLIGIIKSITSHMIEHASIFPEESLFDADGSLRDDEIFKSGMYAKVISNPKNPEEELLISQNIKAIKDELDKITKEDEDLGLLILCFEEGIEKTRYIAEQLCCDKKKVNNLLRKLRYRLKDFNPSRK